MLAISKLETAEDSSAVTKDANAGEIMRATLIVGDGCIISE